MSTRGTGISCVRGAGAVDGKILGGLWLMKHQNSLDKPAQSRACSFRQSGGHSEINN
jgi:hypothetical protein